MIPILGTTFTGEFEPIKEIHDRVVDYNAAHDLDIPIHVDAASGGFVAPFLHPDLEWDFRLPQVKSIKCSGHKYGLTYPGIGFVVWRAEEDLPADLVFHVNYLGGDMPTFTLNFSRPGNQLVGQYYNFLRLGREGYTRVMEAMRDMAVHLSSAIAKMDTFEVISDGTAIPVIAFKVTDSVEVHGVPRLRAAAERWLAGAGVHDAGERDRRGRAADRGARGLQHRPRRRTDRRAREGGGAPRGVPAPHPPPPGGLLALSEPGDGVRVAAPARPGTPRPRLAGRGPVHGRVCMLRARFVPAVLAGRRARGRGRDVLRRVGVLHLGRPQPAGAGPSRTRGCPVIWACIVQSVGTVLFNFNTFDAMFTSLDTEQENRLVWGPDMLGSAAFLIASHLAWVAVCGGIWAVRRDDADWWVAALNYVGSIFFGLSALAAFTLPTTGDLINTTIANMGTFLGAVCFFVGAYLLLPARVRPPSPRP